MATREEKLAKLQRLKELKAQLEQKNRMQAEERAMYDPSEGLGAGEAFAASMGRGAVKTGRGIRTLWNMATGDEADLEEIRAQREEEERLFAPLEERFPKATTAGEITGEILSSAPVGFGTGTVAAKGTQKLGQKVLADRALKNTARFAGAGTGGATEGAIIGAETKEEPGTGAAVGTAVGLTAEAVLPPAVKRLKRIFKRVPDSQLAKNLQVDSAGKLQASPEMEQALNEMGMTIDDIGAEVTEELAAGSPTEAARLALFESEGITPSGRSRIAGSGPEAVQAQQAESYLLRKTDDQAANEFRERVFAENKQMTERFQNLAEELGIPDPQRAGESIQQALQGQKSALASERRAAYETLGQMAGEGGENFASFRVPRERIQTAFDEVRFAPPETQKQLASVLKEYGFADDVPVSPLDEIFGAREAKQLNLGNLEQFRADVSRVLDPTNPKEAAVRRSLMDSIDTIMDDFVEASDGVGMPADIAQQAKRARGLRRKEAVDFKAKDIVESLTETKKGTSTPLVDSAEVLGKVRGLKKEAEFEKMLTMLGRSEEGLEALGNMQAATVMDLLNSSLKKGSQLTGPMSETMPVLSGTSLTKAMDKFGRRKLNRLFKNNPAAMNSLKRLEKIGERRTTGVESIQKGSIPPAVLNKLMDSLSKPTKFVPFVGDAAGEAMAQKAAEREGKRALSQAKDLRPRVEEIEDFVVFNAPRLAAAMGLVGGTTEPLVEARQ